MWQSNARKARFIAAALAGDPSVRRVEDIGSQASQFAMAKAIASGDDRLIRKAGLEAEIARLQRQRAAHIDDQHDIRRRIRTARDDRHHADGRIAAIRQDLARRVPTRGEVFTMEVEGRTTSERKGAGGALLARIRMAVLARRRQDWTIGRLGGFALACSVRRDRVGSDYGAELVLQRTDHAQAIAVDDDLTALGLIARLEHVLDHFDAEIAEHARRRADADSRLAGYEPRLGEAFQLQGELDEKLARIAELEADLAATESAMTDSGGDATRDDAEEATLLSP
jgi:chromosome segregation ATPase